MTDRAKIANVRSILDSTARKSDRRSLKVAGLTGVQPERGVSDQLGGNHNVANRNVDRGHVAKANVANRNVDRGHVDRGNVDRGNVARGNVARGNVAREYAVNPNSSMVPVAERTRQQNASRSLQAADDALSLAERERHELARMEESRLFSDRQLDQLGIVHPRSKNRAMVDAVRQLRTKLFSLRRNGNFSVLVSSVVPHGGGSFVALNLAAAIAFDQTKTSLMVDANLQDPVLHKLLKLIGREGAHGLVDYLEAPEIGIERIVNPSGIPRMRIIPAGIAIDRHSDEHLSSQRCQKLMIDIKERYGNRYVVVDGPPMATSADARILSEMCDFIVLVVPYGAVTSSMLDSIVDEIDETKLAGVVLNDQPE